MGINDVGEERAVLQHSSAVLARCINCKHMDEHQACNCSEVMKITAGSNAGSGRGTVLTTQFWRAPPHLPVEP